MIFHNIFFVGYLGRELYENIRRNAASLRIQKNFRKYIARKAYKGLLSASVTIQTGIRCTAARKELQFRREAKAAVVIQVNELVLVVAKII